MPDRTEGLDLTLKDIEMIERALHTQGKILAVQSQAGRSGAGQKLAELKHLTRRIGRARKNRSAGPATGWMRWLRGMLFPVQRCGQ
jgi:hypothetical protein